MDRSCILCKVIQSLKPADILYEDDYVVSFRDAYPATNAHAVVVPKKHMENMLQVTTEDEVYILSAHRAIQKVAEQLSIEQSGFRVIVNNGPDAEQEVLHLHYHVIGGRKLKWEI